MFFSVSALSASEGSIGECAGAGFGSIALMNVYAANNTSEHSSSDGEFIITRANDLSTQITVSFLLLGTAENGFDYYAINEVIHFDAGESEKSIYISPISDNEHEGTETITLSLLLGDDYILGDHISDTINLLDYVTEPTSANALEPVSSQELKSPQIEQTNSTFASKDILETVNIKNNQVDEIRLNNPGFPSAPGVANEECFVPIDGSSSGCESETAFGSSALSEQTEMASVNAVIASIDATQSLTFSGGGPDCRMKLIKWNETTNNHALPKPPVDSEYIPGYYFVDYTISGCMAGSKLIFSLGYQEIIPPNVKLMQYGPTLTNTGDHWSEVQALGVFGKKVVFTVTDGQKGDNDLTVNGDVSGSMVVQQLKKP